MVQDAGSGRDVEEDEMASQRVVVVRVERGLCIII